jgi:hypothetical protein
VKQLQGVDLLVYPRAVWLLITNPAIIVVPLVVAVIALIVGATAGGGGAVGELTGGLLQLFVQILTFVGIGFATIMADSAWRSGHVAFEAGWEEGRRKAGELAMAALGFTFVIYLAQLVAQFLSSLLGGFALVIVLAAAYFFVYTIPAAAIGGIPGGAALQVALERTRSAPGPTALLTAVCFALLLFLVPSIDGLLFTLFAPILPTASMFVAEIAGAIAKAITYSYIALLLAKVYSDISFTRRW